MQRDRKIEMITAAHPFENPADAQSPHQVKVVFDRQNHALYFSRCPIPFARDAAAPAQYFRHQGIYGYRRELLLRFVRWKPSPLEKAEVARTIARAGEWRKNSRGHHRERLARSRYAGGRPSDRAPAACPGHGDHARLVPDEIYFCYRRCGEFVRQRPRGGLPRHAARTARPARRPAKVRSLSERRSRDDEPVSTRRSLCAQRRRRDRSRSRPLRALHQLRPLAAQQPDQRTGLRERDSEGAPRRLSRQYRAGHPARHRRDQGAHPRRWRIRKQSRRGHHGDRRNDRRHRGAALSRGDPAIHSRSRPAKCRRTCTSRSCLTSGRRAN